MSRQCGAKTQLGGECENLVEDVNDHCAAGHFCPPSPLGNLGDLPGVSVPAVTIDFDSIAAPAPKSEEVEKAEMDAIDRGHGLLTCKALERLLEVNVTYLDTVRGTRQRLSGGEAPYCLQRMQIGTVVLAAGDFGSGGHYLERACAMPGCETPAYVRMKIEELEDPSRLVSHELWERRAAFKTAFDKASTVSPLCHQHRLPPASWTEAKMSAEAGGDAA